MTDTQKRIQAYQALLPGLKERVVAVALLLVMSLTMMTSATFAWLTISRAPEVSGVTTNIASNGSLEIALASGDGKTAPGASQVGDSSATEDQTISAANLTWGNLINLSDPSYGLDHLALRPAQLNTAALLTRPLYGAVYTSDGRVETLTTNYGYTAWVEETANTPAHFGVSNDVGVRAISSIKREQLGYAGDYADAYEAAVIANQMAANTYIGITTNQDWLNVLAKLLGTHMTATLNPGEDKYTNASISTENMESMIDMYEEFVLAHELEAEAIAKQLNLELFAAYGGDTTKYTPFTKADILAINPNGGGQIQSNGDYSYDVLVGSGTDTKTIKITNLKAFLKDYKQLTDDLATLNKIYDGKDFRWTASGLAKVVNNLMVVDDCLIKKTSESKYQTVKSLMDSFSGIGALNALTYRNCDIIVTNGVLYNLEQRVGSNVKISVSITATKNVDTMNLGEQTLTIATNVTTSATKPHDFQKDLDYTDNTLNTGADTSSGDAVAEDTYALAVDFWVRTNAVGTLLTLEGNVLLGDPYSVPVMTEDADGNQVQMYTLTRVLTDEETQETITDTMDVYKKEANGTVTWYAANSHRTLAEEDLGDAEPVVQMEEKRDVIGYEGENRVWDKNDKNYLTADSTTQGVGSCYVYYADTPEDQARSLELLKYLTVAFVDGNGALLATASMDTENYYGNSGRFVVPLKVNDDGIMVKTTGESGEEVIRYAITSLQQNEATRITAIVYLDGRELGNDDVLSAAEIQGQLNIQFGNNANMQPIDNEKLEYEIRTVTATVDNTSFNYDTHEGPMTSTVTIHVDGDQPTNVRAFFQRKINATQGSREEEKTFQPSGSGDWTATYKFTAPGEYILRTVNLDGMEYVLDEPVTVIVNGFTIESLNCTQLGEGRHVSVLTAANSSTLGLSLKFASSDVAKMPTKVQGRFLRDEDGSAVNVEFTYDPNTQLWSGNATFLNSGDYTMQYLVLDDEYVGLAESMWITADIKLGMKTAVYTTDITNFKFAPDEMMEKGTDSLQMQVKIMDNGDETLPGLQNVVLTYRLRNSASTVDVDLTWNASSGYYEGDLQALQAGPGVWEFYRVAVGENIITTATTYPVFEMLSPEPPSFVRIGNTGMQYRPDGNAEMQVTLKYSATATVAAVFKDAAGNSYPVMGTAGTTDADNVTTWNFTVPTNKSGNQDGYWTLETVYLWNYYMADGTYVEWAKDEDGNLEGGELALNADGSLVNNADRDDDNAMVIDVKAKNNGNDYTVKVVQTITVTFAQGQNKDFGKDANGNIFGTFMQNYEGENGINGVYAFVKDFEGPVQGAQSVTITYKYDGNPANFGGYTGGDAIAKTDVFTLTLNQDEEDKTKFVQSASQAVQFAGTYTPTKVEFTFKPEQQIYTVKHEATANSNVPANTPVISVWSKTPYVKFTATNPAAGTIFNAFDVANDEVKQWANTLEDYKVVCYFRSSSASCGLSTKGTPPTVTAGIYDGGAFESASCEVVSKGKAGNVVFSFTNGTTNSTQSVGTSTGQGRNITTTGVGTNAEGKELRLTYNGKEYTVNLVNKVYITLVGHDN